MNRNATRARTGVTGAVLALSPGTADSPGTARGGRSPAPLPPLPGVGHLLSGIAAAGPSAVWVVGSVGQKPLAARWEGASWTVLSDPSESSLASAALVGARLRAVASVSDETSPASQADGPGPAEGANPVAAGPLGHGGPVEGAGTGSGGRADGEPVIAVGGAYDRLERADVALIRHWTGSAWTSWDAPELLRGLVLNAVASAGPGHAWAVGHASPHGPRALHWDGSTWESSDIPDIPRGRLVAVTATAPDDVWAVGSDDRAGLVLHFDGRSWTRVPSPAKAPLTGVSAAAPDDVWAVGQHGVLHWDGRRWTRAKTPVTSANTVMARASDDVWIAGGSGDPAHYDGRRWSVAPSPEAAVWLASAPASDGGLWLAGTRSHEDTPGAAERAVQPDDAQRP